MNSATFYRNGVLELIFEAAGIESDVPARVLIEEQPHQDSV